MRLCFISSSVTFIAVIILTHLLELLALLGNILSTLHVSPHFVNPYNSNLTKCRLLSFILQMKPITKESCAA